MSTRGGRTPEKASQKRVLKDEQEFFQHIIKTVGTFSQKAHKRNSLISAKLSAPLCWNESLSHHHENNQPINHCTDLCIQFPFFLQTSFRPPPLRPTPGKPGSLQPSLFAPFPNQVHFLIAGGSGDPGMRRGNGPSQPPARAARPGCGPYPRLLGRGRVRDALSGVPKEKDDCHSAPKSHIGSDREERSVEVAAG